MKKRMLIFIFAAGMCLAAAGCGSTSSDDAAAVSEETSEESTANEDDAVSDAEESETTSSEAAESSSSQSETDSSQSASTQDNTADIAVMAEDEFAGNYVNGDTGMYLEIEVSDSGESDYTLTWSNGTDWDSSYNALAQDGQLIVTIEMNYDAVLTIEKTDSGLSITGDDVYYDNVVENRPMDGDFEKY
ncbi:MAG: hypothetical protein LUC83_03785 [Clostridiales bacterium]|nr:hypothetical protein [Clostridiales bacterium]